MSTRYTDLHANDSARLDGITRRSFLAAGGAAALSFFLPSIGPVGDGYAYAIETGSVGSDGQPEFDIYVITREEIGISVVDVTNDAKDSVAGASITLTSSKGDASATVVADENGLAVFNLKTSGLGVPIELEGVGNSYRFEGSIKTTVPGQDDVWMDFETGRMRADGGSAVQTPLRRKESQATPFFTMLSFDGWDILYTENDTVSTPLNTDDHTFAGKLYVPNGTKAKVELIARAGGKEDIVIFTQNLSVASNVAELSQSANYLFLYNKNKNLLPDGRSYLYRVTVNDIPYTVAVKFSVRQAPVPKPTYTTSSFSPSTQSMGSFSLPSDIPAPLGGTSLSVWCPSLPLIGWASPQGYAFFGATISTKVSNSASFANESDWKEETCGSAKEQFNKLADSWSKSLDKLSKRSNLLDPSASVSDKFDVSRSISIDVTAQLYALAKWNLSTRLWEMTVNGLVNAALAFTFSAQTTIGPVPVFLTFKLGLASRIAISLGVETYDFGTADLPRTAGMGYTATISIALTLGAGVPGVANAGLRGSGYLAFYVGFDNSGVVPHAAAGFGLSADVVIQMLLFTWTGKLWSYKKDPFYDNASSNLLQDARPDLSLNPTEFALGYDGEGKPVYSHSTPFDPTKGLDFDEFVKQSSIVTEKTLGKTSEVTGKRTSNALLSEAAAPQITLFDDGTAMVDLSGMIADAEERIAANADDPAEFDYEYVGEKLDTVCSAVGGVAGIADSGGVKPTVDGKIASRIFGSPNCKVVIFLETPYLFRLISVEYDDNGTKKTRTRLAVQKMGENSKWSSPQVLEFRNFDHSGAQRIDTFDYDFDVYANESATTGYVNSGLCVVLLSGTRPQGDSTDFFNVGNSTIMSVGVFDSGLRCTMAYSWKDVPGSSSAPYQALLLPRITPVNAKAEKGGKTMGVALLYMRRTADSVEKLFGASAHVTAEFSYLIAEQIYMGARVEVDPSVYDLKAFDNSERGSEKASFSFAVQSDSGMSIYTAFPYRDGKALTAETAHLFLNANAASGMKFDVKHNVKNATGLENSQPWPRRSAILVPENGILTALSFDPEVENGTFKKTQVGPQDAKIGTFVVSTTGDTLYYLVNQDGEMPQPNGESPTTSTEKVSQHTIYACALVDDLFSKPFPLANTDHAIDALENAYAGSTYSFIATCITNMANNSADIYYINVPAVATATPIGFVSENAFVCAGADDEPFLLELRNDGNVILTGCTVELRDADLPEPNNIVDTRVRYMFEPANLTGSIWNPELLATAGSEAETLQADSASAGSGDDAPYSAECLETLGIGEDHMLVNPGAAGVLLPGYSGQYRISFNIPTSWKSGHKNVYITMKDFMYDTLKLGEDVNDVLQYPSGIHPDDAHEVTIPTVTPDSDDNLGDAVLAPEGSNPGTDEPGTGNSGESGTSGSSGSPNAGASGEKPKGTAQNALNVPTLVQSGDSAAFSLAGLAIAAAVAGATAYSARRLAIEQEGLDADSTEHEN